MQRSGDLLLGSTFGRLLFALIYLPLALSTTSVAEAASKSPPYEIIRSHTDFEVEADGSYLESNEVAYRILTVEGLQALQQTELSYTEGFETLEVPFAYTMKVSGQRFDVSQDSILKGYGATSQPGFEDLRTLTVIFPNVAVGDEIVLATVHRQLVPWFANEFAMRMNFSRQIVWHDTEISLTAPANSFPVSIDSKGLTADPREDTPGKSRWTWRYQNEVPVTFESDAIDEADDGARLAVSSFPSFDTVAREYTKRFQGAADVTPDIQALADQLTAGITDRRAQARKLYNWVSANIAYVNIVLGAGGFTPHSAAHVLQTKYGDCKDHVILLQSLLAAKHIDSSPVLIFTGGSFKLSDVASPFLFDHLITFVPEFDLYLDSTAQFAPFGVLPFPDQGKPVVIVSTGKLARTPVSTADNSAVHTTRTIRFSEDGSIDGDASVTSTGPLSVQLRAQMSAVPATGEDKFLQGMLGPGADGSFNRGDPQDLADSYSFSSHFHQPSIVNFPGPGALPAAVGYSPYSFTELIASTMPPSRNSPYVCASLTATQSTTIDLPTSVSIETLPPTQKLSAPGISLDLTYEQRNTHSVVVSQNLRIQHNDFTCSPDYYTQVHSELQRMTGALRSQIIYK